MRTPYRAACALVALAASFPIGIPAAHAGSAPALAPTEGAWFWQKQVSGNIPGANAPYPGQIPSDKAGFVDPDRLAVSYQGGKETSASGEEIAAPEKETYLMWDIFEIVEPDSTIDEFVFVLPLDPQGESNKLIQPGKQPELIACRPLGGFATAYGDSFANKPKDDCGDAVFATFDATAQAYVFDITTYAQDWVNEDNFGIAIRPKTDETVPFQLQFKNFTDAVARLAFTPPPVVVDEPDYTPPVDTTPTDTGTVTTPGFEPAPQPQPQPQAPAAPRPQVLTPRAPIRPVAATPILNDTSFDLGFGIAVAFGLALLALLSVVLGDDRVVAPGAHGRESRLDRVLRDRSGGLVPAVTAESTGRRSVRTA